MVQVVHAERLQRAKVEPDAPLTHEEREILEDDQSATGKPIGAPPAPLEEEDEIGADADELIDAYMTSFNMGRAGPPEQWKQRCRF